MNQKTIGAPLYFKSYKLNDNSIINIQFIDSNGQEQCKGLIESYYKKADSIILVYDITNRKSFDECKNYYCETIKKKCKNNIKVILLGNKNDLENNRKISFQEGDNFAYKNNYIFMEASCLKNENVFEAFGTIIETTFNEIKINEKKEGKEEISKLKNIQTFKNENNRENCNII